MTESWTVLDEAGLQEHGRRLAALLQPPLVIYLRGELGAGKTTLVRALLGALGHRGSVKSPTYGLLEHYPLERLNVLHLDLYRLVQKDELEFLGIVDLMDDKTLLLVEWPPEDAPGLPSPDLVIHLEYAGSHRRLRYETYSSSGNRLYESVQHLL